MREKRLWQVILLLILASIFYACKKSNLEHALELSGKNRPELEKVLEHYSRNHEDKLKLKAAQFLIENMDSYSFVTSIELQNYNHTLDSIFSLNKPIDAISNEQDSLLTQLKKPNSFYFDSIPDLQYVSAGFLIDNIDRAFEAWKSPFAEDMNFDDFCEYLLPYKANEDDHPDFWRSAYRDAFYPYVKFDVDNSCRLDSGVILQYPPIEMTGKTYLTLPAGLFDSVPEFSVSCWVKPDEYKSFVRVFDLGKDYTCYVGFMPYTKDGIAEFEIMTDTPHDWHIVMTAPLPLEKRSHIAITYFNHYISFYIDGISQKRMQTTLTNKDLTANYIGKSHYNDSIYFTGNIDSFRIYNRELNYAEINALAGKTELPEINKRILEVVQRLRLFYNVYVTNQTYISYSCRPVQLMNIKKGICSDYVDLGTYIYRSLGIPAGIDFIPQWATRSVGHSWNVFHTGNNGMYDYSFGDDTIGNHIKDHEEKAAKIFRYTYAKQPNSLAMQNKDEEFLPPTFQNPCIKDVTDSYLECKDITVSFTKPHSRKRKYAYLCNFNNHDWIPVFWGKINGDKSTFTKMGKDVAYLPAYYDQEGITPAADPFILTKEGEIKKLIPNHSSTQTLILKRKYKPGKVPEKGKLLLGCRFQVANKPDFSDSLTVYEVTDVPEINYNLVNLNLNKPYRYFRFLSLSHLMGSEISEIEVYQKESEKKLTGKVLGDRNSPRGWEVENVFDGDPLTSYQCDWNDQGWAGLDFGKPMNLAYFRYLPRNDDNFIKEGEEYELFYWENYQWNSLGKQTGTSKQYLEYTNVPTNALFWLRNLTKGKEERIFTYENGEQVWW